MFSKKKSPNPSSQYAFGPNTAAAANSSDAVRRQEQETIYHPLPPSTRHGISTSTASATRNPFADTYQADRNSSSTSASVNQSRSGSPSLSHPLLSHANNDSNPPSPVTHHGNAFARNSPANMPAPTRSYGRDGAAGMPPRGESRNALLRDGQVSWIFSRPCALIFFAIRAGVPVIVKRCAQYRWGGTEIMPAGPIYRGTVLARVKQADYMLLLAFRACLAHLPLPFAPCIHHLPLVVYAPPHLLAASRVRRTSWRRP